MIKTQPIYKQLYVALLLCLLQMAGIDVYAQQPADSLIVDSISAETPLLMELPSGAADDSPVDSTLADSIAAVNESSKARLDSITNPQIPLSTDTIFAPPPPEIPKKVWTPNPTKATWLAVVFPGGGQIYNRKYWKLPIIYGGFAGCAYALSWNNNMFQDYSQAYVDIMDKNPATNSYYDLLPPGVTVDETTDTRYGPLLKSRKDYYRRYRDISVFAFIGVYLLSIVDAYVDAELSNFDITPDLSMRVEPTIVNTQHSNFMGRKGNALGLQCSFSF